MSKETFKSFAKNHPELAQSVMNGKATWQKLYELYDIYGEDNSVWDNYFERSTPETQSTFKDLFNTFRNLDLESVQKGVTNLQKTIGLLQDIGLGASAKQTTRNDYYEPRPMYKYFED